MIRQLTRDLIDFCYPGRCTVCDASIESAAERLCLKCLSEFDALTSRSGCLLCGMPLGGVGDPCPRCMGAGMHPFDRVIRLGVFQDPIKQLIHELKYHRRWPVADILANALINHEPAKVVLAQTQVIVPVPLHPLRQMMRGFNQSELIARRIARVYGIKLALPVIRVRNTEMQTRIKSVQKREENLRNAFGLVSPRSVQDKHVLLLDDVMTTGATLKSLARCLADAEPASVCAMTVAVADPKRSQFELI